jgi:multidrug efflux pump subunit AcrB
LVTVTANIHKKDLGAATTAVQKAIKNAGEPPRGVLVELKGQSDLLSETLSSLQTGLLIAVVIMFLLLAATYQSFKLSLVVLLDHSGGGSRFNRTAATNRRGH